MRLTARLVGCRQCTAEMSRWGRRQSGEVSSDGVSEGLCSWATAQRSLRFPLNKAREPGAGQEKRPTKLRWHLR